MHFSRYNSNQTVNAGQGLTITHDISDLGFEKAPVPIALPDKGQIFTPTYVWSECTSEQVTITSHAHAYCIVSYGLLLLEPM